MKVRKFGDASLAQQKNITILGDCLTITPDEFPDGMVLCQRLALSDASCHLTCSYDIITASLNRLIMS